jgi:hypothetical protein
MKPVYLSATQIDNFRRCPRVWAWDKIGRIPRTPAQSLELGSRVHEILEAYYKGEGAPDLSETWRFDAKGALFYPGKIASSMISKAIPAKAVPLLEVELDFKNTTVGAAYGVIYVGKIDVHWRTRMPVGEALVLRDHKTSSDPAAWGKKEEDLKNDTQCLIYSRVGLDLYPEVEAVDFGLNYGSTKLQSKKNYHPNWVMSAAKVRERFESQIEPLAIYMAQLKREERHPLEIEPNPNACGDFRGCPHRERCQLTAKQKIGALIMSEKGSLVDRLLAKSKASKNETPQEEETESAGINPPETDVVEETPEEPEKLVETPPAKKPTATKVKRSTAKKKTETKPEEPKKEEPVETPLPEAGARCEIAPDRETEFRNLRRNIAFVSGLAIGTTADNRVRAEVNDALDGMNDSLDFLEDGER